MKPSEALHVHREAIRQITRAHRVGNARVFGSVLRDQDTELSDLDILVDPTPDTTLLDIGALRHELRNALAHGYFQVDLTIVWRTIERDLPVLHRQIETILQSLQDR